LGDSTGKLIYNPPSFWQGGKFWCFYLAQGFASLRASSMVIWFFLIFESCLFSKMMYFFPQFYSTMGYVLLQHHSLSCSHL